MPGSKSQLVCQYLENVSRSALERHQNIIREYVGRRHGVYALYRRDKLYYVGLAINLRNRLKAHLRDRHGASWDRFSVYLTIRNDHIRELEALVLRIVRPTGNKQIGRFARSQNLRVDLARRIRAHQRSELLELLPRWRLPKHVGRAKLHIHASKNGRLPVLAKYTKAPFSLKARFKGKLLRARVRRDGSLRFKGLVYNSPSLAAAAACGRRTCNGWRFWTFQRAPGDWVPLKELRR